MISKREEIIAAARVVLIREGSAGFSMRKVAQHLGMSLGNLQYYFPTRAALLDGLLSADVEKYRRTFEEICPGDHGGRDHLHRFLREVLGVAGRAEDIAVFRALFSFSEPEVVESLERYYRDLYDLLEKGLAQLAGRSAESPAVRRGAALLFPYLDGYETTAECLALDRREVARLLTDTVWAIILDGDTSDR